MSNPFVYTSSSSQYSLTFYHSSSQQESTQRIAPTLEQLSNDIRIIARHLNITIQNKERELDQGDGLELEHARRLRDCIGSSASIVSSTSTARGETMGDVASVVADSDFGDCLPRKPSELTLRWIYDNPEGGTKMADNLGPDGSGTAADTKPDTDEDTDSDGELEAEMVMALFNSHREKVAANDFESAERLLRSCRSRLFLPSESPPLPSKRKQPVSKLDLLNAQLEVYTKQKKWSEAQVIATERISLRQQSGEPKNSEVLLADILTLTDILFQRGSYAEAQLQARRALRGYRKLGPSGAEGTERTLTVLIQICSAMENMDELEAYRSLLIEILKAKQTSPSPIAVDLSVTSLPNKAIPKSTTTTNPEQPRISLSSSLDETDTGAIEISSYPPVDDAHVLPLILLQDQEQSSDVSPSSPRVPLNDKYAGPTVAPPEVEDTLVRPRSPKDLHVETEDRQYAGPVSLIACNF